MNERYGMVLINFAATCLASRGQSRVWTMIINLDIFSVIISMDTYVLPRNLEEGGLLGAPVCVNKRQVFLAN